MEKLAQSLTLSKCRHTRVSPAEVFLVFLFFFFFRGLLLNTGCKQKWNSCQSTPTERRDESSTGRKAFPTGLSMPGGPLNESHIDPFNFVNKWKLSHKEKMK